MVKEEETLANRNDEFLHLPLSIRKSFDATAFLSMMSWKTFLNLQMEQVVRPLA